MIPPEAFNKALTCLAIIHRREVVHLREQVLRLQGSIIQQPNAATSPTFRENVAATRSADVDGVTVRLEEGADLLALIDDPNWSGVTTDIAKDLASMSSLHPSNDPRTIGLLANGHLSDIRSFGYPNIRLSASRGQVDGKLVDSTCCLQGMSPRIDPPPLAASLDVAGAEWNTVGLTNDASADAGKNKHVPHGGTAADQQVQTGSNNSLGAILEAEEYVDRADAPRRSDCTSSVTLVPMASILAEHSHIITDLSTTPKTQDKMKHRVSTESIVSAKHRLVARGPKMKRRASDESCASVTSSLFTNSHQLTAEGFVKARATALNERSSLHEPDTSCHDHADQKSLINDLSAKFQELEETVEQMHKIQAKRDHCEKRHITSHMWPEERSALTGVDGQSHVRFLRKLTTMTFSTENAIDRMVESPKFDVLCGVVIAFNSVFIGYNVNMTATSGSSVPEQKYLGWFFSSFFLVELVLRLKNQKLRYFTSEQRNWNLFDMLLVILSAVEFVMDEILKESGTSISSLKTIKMLRIMRVFRVFRFFHELAVLVLMILDSMMSLMWALLMLGIIIYVFAILFTESTIMYRSGEAVKDFQDQDRLSSEVERWFGTVPKAIYTLFQAMLGGVSWGVVTDALLATGFAAPTLFFFYVAFTMLVVLNIITGVFVENAMEIARTQREFLIQKEMELRESYVREMRDLFEQMDEDGSGTVSYDEVLKYFVDPHVQSYFHALGLDTQDIERLFRLIDTEQCGEVHVEEFLEGCLRLKGMARSIDIHTVLYENKKMEKHIAHDFAVLKEALGVADAYYSSHAPSKASMSLTSADIAKIGKSSSPRRRIPQSKLSLDVVDYDV